jgi:RNA polymerase sigma-70 factor (ECF subfamily)
MSDPSLIRQLLRHQGDFMAYIMAIVHDLDAAEEIFQNAAVVVIQHDATEPIHDFRAWAKEIVRRQALRHVQREGRGSRYTATEPELLEQIDLVCDELAGDDAADVTLRQREIEALRECAGRLPERQRVMVAMRYERRASFDTIGVAVGSTAGAVQRALSRTRRTLHDCVRHRLEGTGATS